MERDNERGPAPGTSEVHSELSTRPSKGVGMSGSYDAGAAGTGAATGGRVEEAKDRLEHAKDTLASRADDLKDEARGRVDEMRERVDSARGEVMDRADEVRGMARQKLDGAKDEATRLRGRLQARTDRMLDQTGARERIDAHPLVALGLAFGVGYMLAGSGGKSTGRRGKVKTQIRSAVVGAITAAAAQEVRSMLGFESGQAGGLGGIFDSMTGTSRAGGTSQAGRPSSASAYGA